MRLFLVAVMVCCMGWFATPAWAQDLDELRTQVETLKKQLEQVQRTLQERAQEQQRRALEQQQALEQQKRQEVGLEALKAKQELEALRAQEALAILKEEIQARPRTGFLSRGAFGSFKVDFSGYLKNEAISSNAVLAGGDLILVDPANGTTLDKYKFTLGPKQSRFRFDIQGPKIFGAESGGKIEADLFGDASDEGSFPGRFDLAIDHLFTQLKWDHGNGRRTILEVAGSDFTPFGDFFPESLNFITGAGWGGHFLNTPQIRVEHYLPVAPESTLKFTLAALRPTSGVFGIKGFEGSVTNDFLVGDAELSGFPWFDGQIQFQDNFLGSAPFFGQMTPFTIGFAGRIGNERIVALNGDEARFFTKGVEVRLFVPIIGSRTGHAAGTLGFKARAYTGENLDAGFDTGLAGIVVKKGRAPRFGAARGDAFGPTVAGLLGPLANGSRFDDFTEADGWGGYGELKYYITDTLWVTAFGGGQTLFHDNEGVISGFAFSTTGPLGLSGVKAKVGTFANVKWIVPGTNSILAAEFWRTRTEFQDKTVGGWSNSVQVAWFWFF